MVIASLSWSTAQKTWIRISYEINKLEIIEKFCINKEETTFKCEGKCHLKTEIDKVDDEESKPFENSETEQKIQLFNSPLENFKISTLLFNKTALFFYSNVGLQGYIPFIFKPPRF